MVQKLIAWMNYPTTFKRHPCSLCFICVETGYVKNLLSGNLYFYKVQWMGKWRYFAGVLPSLFFVS